VGWWHGGWGGWSGWDSWNWPWWRWHRQWWYNYPGSTTVSYGGPAWYADGVGTYYFNTNTADELEGTGGATYVWPDQYYLYINPQIYNYAPWPESYYLYKGPGMNAQMQGMAVSTQSPPAKPVPPKAGP